MNTKAVEAKSDAAVQATAKVHPVPPTPVDGTIVVPADAAPGLAEFWESLKEVKS